MLTFDCPQVQQDWELSVDAYDKKPPFDRRGGLQHVCNGFGVLLAEQGRRQSARDAQRGAVALARKRAAPAAEARAGRAGVRRWWRWCAGAGRRHVATVALSGNASGWLAAQVAEAVNIMPQEERGEQNATARCLPYHRIHPRHTVAAQSTARAAAAPKHCAGAAWMDEPPIDEGEHASAPGTGIDWQGLVHQTLVIGQRPCGSRSRCGPCAT